MAIDNNVNLSQVANQYQKNDILTKPQKYQVNPNGVDKTPEKDTVQLSSGLTTKEKVGIAAVATTVVAVTLALLGRNGHLGDGVQKFLGGKAKKAAQEMGEHTHTPKAPAEPKAPVEPKTSAESKTSAEPKVPVESKAPAETKAPAESKAPAEPKVPAEAKTPAEPKANAEREVIDRCFKTLKEYHETGNFDKEAFTATIQELKQIAKNGDISDDLNAIEAQALLPIIEDIIKKL